MTTPATLSADRPSTDSAQDLFGHATFARTLAKATRDYRSSDGIVLALYGPWGCGKSTVLAYVQHELEQGPEEGRPVVVPFNPWWFSGQEHLAKAFLGQMQAVLPAKYEKFRAFGDKLAEFSEAVGGVGDVIGAATGQGWVGGLFRRAAKLAGSSPKDVPALKQVLSDLLLEQKKRVLVVIDDIDRLAPDEVRQLFTVIKALADFPYVTYLLAFDREVAAMAINEQTGLPGDRYLEKIIQVPFELPRPDRSTLHRALFKRLDDVMAPTPEGRFDGMHWNNIFHSGLGSLITVPRDVVRLINALSVTYPAVLGEVNPVDFIAIEALRVFLPSVYDAIRKSPTEFAGHGQLGGYNDGQEKERAKAFHDGWLNTVPNHLRASTRDMVTRLFPRLASVWGNMHYGSDSVVKWRRQLRICAPEVFQTYFRLSLPQGAVSRADIDALLAATSSSRSFAPMLEKAADVKDAHGISKVPALLDRFVDYVPDDVEPADAPTVIAGLFKVGDELLSLTDRDPGMFGFGNEQRIGRIAYLLLKNLEPTRRTPLLIDALDHADALQCSQYLIASLAQEAENADKGEGESTVSTAETQALKAAWSVRVKQLAANADFIDRPSVACLVNDWRKWGDPAEATAWWQAAVASDDGLLKLIASLATESRSQSANDLVWKIHLHVDPRVMEPYGDVHTLAARVRNLLDQGGVAEQHVAAARQFVLACDRMKAGQNPDAFRFLDD